MNATALKLFGFLFVALFTTTSLQASNIEENLDKALRTKIVQMVSNPDLINHGLENATAVIKFEINEAQEIEVTGVDTEHTYIKKFIEQRLNSRKIELEGLKTDIVYTINLTFRVAY